MLVNYKKKVKYYVIALIPSMVLLIVMLMLDPIEAIP